ncbi:MAG: hypothetical protein JW955_08705 [Sedimentisphaerales bacterium]|nr:hypothetical protein [Sedimentisphaerales bacterium]
MNTLRTQISTALDALIEEENGIAFQRLAYQCLRSRWPSLASVAERADLGEDAITILGESSDGVIRSFACSLTAKLSKVRSDAARAVDNRSDVKELIFATPRVVTRKVQQKWEKEIEREFRRKLIVVERSELISILERPEHQWICVQHLNITVGVLQEVLGRHLIEALRRAGSDQLGVQIDNLIEEEACSTPSLPLGWNTLIVGPPFIGKTCWAVRRAWRTCCDHVPSSILWFNAIRDGAEDLTFLDRNLALEEDYVIVIDDVHVVRANPGVWTYPAATFATRRPGRVRVLWIARDESIAESLNIGSERVKIDPFPIELVVGLFLERLKSLPRGLRIVAALEAGLDPALGRAIGNRHVKGPHVGE